MYLVSGESTYQCESCRMKQFAVRSDDTPRHSTPKADDDVTLSLAVTLI